MTYFTEYLWFDMIGYLSVFTTILSWQVMMFLAGFMLAFLFIYLNIRLARTFIKNFQDESGSKHSDTHGLVIPAAGIIANTRLRNIRIPLLGMIAVVIMVLLTSFAPAAYQQMRVEPTELQLEEPYLLHNIEYPESASDFQISM